eukprot:gene22903-29668_t
MAIENDGNGDDSLSVISRYTRFKENELSRLKKLKKTGLVSTLNRKMKDNGSRHAVLDPTSDAEDIQLIRDLFSGGESRRMGPTSIAVRIETNNQLMMTPDSFQFWQSGDHAVTVQMFQSFQAGEYSGNVLQASSGDERVANSIVLKDKLIAILSASDLAVQSNPNPNPDPWLFYYIYNSAGTNDILKNDINHRIPDVMGLWYGAWFLLDSILVGVHLYNFGDVFKAILWDHNIA